VHSITERTTFVIAPDGKTIATIGGVAPEANVEQALAIAQDLAAKRAAKS
jgi:thioredoxin-dependent peroxiredoxin